MFEIRWKSDNNSNNMIFSTIGFLQYQQLLTLSRDAGICLGPIKNSAPSKIMLLLYLQVIILSKSILVSFFIIFIFRCLSSDQAHRLMYFVKLKFS